ncbi:MAG: hypothetical protein HYZ90_04100 [Candidatus Omnitrophica bacterium]|nr:hypothetical protein [Candidatus Omnitrophota bacterium]
MKRGWIQISAAGLALGLAWAGATAQTYRPAPTSRPRASDQEEESFERSVDLDRFRKGNYGWDTQELVASGLTALHREHEEILKELRGLRRKVEELEEGR